MRLKGRPEFSERIRRKADALCRGVLLEVHGRLIRRTPVDTGRARGNWNVGVNQIDRSVADENMDPSGRTSIQVGQATILADFKAGDVGYVTNGLPYIPALEDGSSQQAPEGMVKVTAAEVRPLVGKILAEVARGE